MGKEFDLGTILSVTSGLMLGDGYDLLLAYEFLYGREVAFHELYELYPEAREHVLSIYPQLRGIGENVTFAGEKAVDVFVEEQKRKFGEKLLLTPINYVDEDKMWKGKSM